MDVSSRTEKSPMGSKNVTRWFPLGTPIGTCLCVLSYIFFYYVFDSPMYLI